MTRWGILAGGIGILLLAAGCHETVGRDGPRVEPAPPPPPTQCHAESAGWARGEHATDALVERAKLASGARTVRVMRPGEAHTMEFNPNRLNLDVDDSGRIIEVRCG